MPLLNEEQQAVVRPLLPPVEPVPEPEPERPRPRSRSGRAKGNRSLITCPRLPKESEEEEFDADGWPKLKSAMKPVWTAGEGTVLADGPRPLRDASDIPRRSILKRDGADSRNEGRRVSVYLPLLPQPPLPVALIPLLDVSAWQFLPAFTCRCQTKADPKQVRFLTDNDVVPITPYIRFVKAHHKPKRVSWIDDGDEENSSVVESVLTFDSESPPCAWYASNPSLLEESEYMLDLESEPKRVSWFGDEDDSSVVRSVHQFDSELAPCARLDHDGDVVMTDA